MTAACPHRRHPGVPHRLWVIWDNTRNRAYWLLADHVRIIRSIHETGVRVDELTEDVHELTVIMTKLAEALLREEKRRAGKPPQLHVVDTKP